MIQDNHVKSIFRLWLSNSSSELPLGAIEALKKVVLIGFRCLFNNPDKKAAARKGFYQLYTDLYTVDMSFGSNSGNNVAASLDLSRNEFVN
jgi:hypothetical protein